MIPDGVQGWVHLFEGIQAGWRTPELTLISEMEIFKAIFMGTLQASWPQFNAFLPEFETG